MQINNQVTLIGRLGQDPSYMTTKQGNDLTRLNLATSSYLIKDGKRKESTQWHRCIAWGPLALTIHQYLKKGSRVAIQGELRYGKYTDNAGIERSSTDIVISSFTFLDQKKAA